MWGICFRKYLLFRTEKPHAPCPDTVSCLHGITFCCYCSLNTFISEKAAKSLILSGFSSYVSSISDHLLTTLKK